MKKLVLKSGTLEITGNLPDSPELRELIRTPMTIDELAVEVRKLTDDAIIVAGYNGKIKVVN